MIIQIDPIKGRVVCPLCGEITEIEIIATPVLHNLGGQVAISLRPTAFDDRASWEHVTTKHADQFAKDFPDGARRGIHEGGDRG